MNCIVASMSSLLFPYDIVTEHHEKKSSTQKNTVFCEIHNIGQENILSLSFLIYDKWGE
jgi:hypothetical protein